MAAGGFVFVEMSVVVFDVGFLMRIDRVAHQTTQRRIVSVRCPASGSREVLGLSTEIITVQHQALRVGVNSVEHVHGRGGVAGLGVIRTCTDDERLFRRAFGRELVAILPAAEKLVVHATGSAPISGVRRIILEVLVELPHAVLESDFTAERILMARLIAHADAF